MTIAKPYLLFILFVSIVCLGTGCATLPNVSDVIDGRRRPRNLAGSFRQGSVISPEKQGRHGTAEAIGRPTDVLGRHNAVVESVTESPLTKGTRSPCSPMAGHLPAMFKALQNAKDHINLESYIIEDDETGRRFADLLLQKQSEGVQVRLIYDSVGSITTPAPFFQRLRDGGIEVVEFNPINPLKDRENWGLTHRDHRKILIADGTVAIIGGINISEVYSSSPLKRKQREKAPIHWRDTDVQIEGPAVAELQKLFLDTWVKQKGLQRSERNYFPDLKDAGNALVRVVGSTPGEINRIPFIVYVSAMTFAEHSIHLTNSYFIPDDQILKALTDAAKRGVDVKIILPGTTDSQLALHAQRYHYSVLLKSGVKVYEHGASLLHAKTAVIDKVWSTVGSTNMDFLSMLNNDEVNAIILSQEFAVEMEKMFAGDLAESRQIHWDEWQDRPLLPRFREWFVNLFIRWL